MKFSEAGQEHVAAPPAAVQAFVQDPERVAGCLPDVQTVTRLDDQSAQVTVGVGLGLLRGQLRLHLRVQPGPAADAVQVLVEGGGLGSHVQLTAQARVMEAGNGHTRLDWQGEATLDGAVTRLGEGLVQAQARRLLGRTFQQLAAQVQAKAGTLA